ncbi:DUF262 domain-containing protein [Massilia sp. GCM10020059]|uniref:DUF262 domain-containing protein n=1 Tax=Massilia agrisoli TaxID=2892444 RepID=A0ABS8IND6_9BURK|nr:DUF262 domain-containing protein [Massilia agrisoli]MCC6069984.1 DUF262 domain-containing protein [Massilia agrisoli]
MKIKLERRALDKLYKRRDRYEIPDWQRTKVWDQKKKQLLIDSILRGWRLPKFYLVKVGSDQFEVVDGQQRLNAIFNFFSNELSLSEESAQEFGGHFYKDLSPTLSDAFDDYEIDYDEISETNEVELKAFFQRLQQGLPLTASEKLNAEHGNLRNFCKKLPQLPFFKVSIAVPDTRFAHFDIASKVAMIEVESVDAGLRYDDIKAVFASQVNFSPSSAAAKRISKAFAFLAKAFPAPEPVLKNRTIVQSVATLACRLVATGKESGLEGDFATFVRKFMQDLATQVELGQAATDADFVRFQKSINANVKAGAKTRHEILLRKALVHSGALAGAFDTAALKESGISGRISELGKLITAHVSRLNTAYSAIHGKDLFKATNKTATAQANMREQITNLMQYQTFVDNLYFLFWEGPGDRLNDSMPQSFIDVNALRTDLQHDVDHGKATNVKAKKKKIGATFQKLGGETSPESLDPGRFVLIQANLMTALEHDLSNLQLPVGLTKSGHK